MTRKSWPALLALVSGALLGLAACAPPTSYWSASEQPPRQNRVEYIRLTHAVAFAPGRSTLAPDETDRLEDFLHRQKVGYGDKVTLIVSGDSSRIDLARRKALTRLLHHAGLYDVAVRSAKAPAVFADQATLVVGRYVVTPPPCPDWSKPSDSDVTNTSSSNLGCANTVNLGMMVADPGDLVHGEEMGPANGAQSTLGIVRYRSDKVIVPADPDTGGSSSSSSGSGGGAGGSP